MIVQGALTEHVITIGAGTIFLLFVVHHLGGIAFLVTKFVIGTIFGL